MAQSERVAIWVRQSASPGEKVEMLPLSEKVNILDIENKLYAEFAKIYDKNQPSTCEIVGGKIVLILLLYLNMSKLWTQCI